MFDFSVGKRCTKRKKLSEIMYNAELCFKNI